MRLDDLVMRDKFSMEVTNEETKTAHKESTTFEETCYGRDKNQKKQVLVPNHIHAITLGIVQEILDYVR